MFNCVLNTPLKFIHELQLQWLILKGPTKENRTDKKEETTEVAEKKSKQINLLILQVRGLILLQATTLF